MSDFTVSYPRPDDVDRYRDALGLARGAIVRDIVRMVSIGQMAHTGELNDEWVLAGSMGLRLRGSTRFTMMDADTSRVGLPDDNALSRALTLEDDDLVVTPASPEEWKSSRKLIKAQPVDYQAFFASVGEPVTDSFTFTVSWRGLFESPERLTLTHPYPELIMPEVAVPVMDLTEQTAEKIVGWCAHGLIKHYVDVAWIFEQLEDEVVADRLGSLTERNKSPNISSNIWQDRRVLPCPAVLLKQGDLQVNTGANAGQTATTMYPQSSMVRKGSPVRVRKRARRENAGRRRPCRVAQRGQGRRPHSSISTLPALSALSGGLPRWRS